MFVKTEEAQGMHSSFQRSDAETSSAVAVVLVLSLCWSPSVTVKLCELPRPDPLPASNAASLL